ncbi:hypothetical protein OR571_02465 [Psychrobacillus sp. NEAU-3TGS]|uniref:hypothetical protein n=1 Tax=Psychrobacillus sp. NEAU-3TGS TaxID=2995412 RepID=UPI0024969799|nr:hypothetical protein [Psychrobacillus sp. NEAU-3TGS]MDI2586024.1 hypothetical protein [Psychrobacillus sp. NEAU-3TGS]
MGQFEQAIEKLKEVTIPEILHHPIDLSTFYEKDAYMALCYLELGQKDKAMKAVQVAVDNIRKMPETPYKKFVEEIYKKVFSPYQN